MLRTALGNSPRDAGPHYALGLALTRLKQTDAALADLRQRDRARPRSWRAMPMCTQWLVAFEAAAAARRSALLKTLAKHPNDSATR